MKTPLYSVFLLHHIYFDFIQQTFSENLDCLHFLGFLQFLEFLQFFL